MPLAAQARPVTPALPAQQVKREFKAPLARLGLSVSRVTLGIKGQPDQSEVQARPARPVPLEAQAQRVPPAQQVTLEFKVQLDQLALPAQQATLVFKAQLAQLANKAYRAQLDLKALLVRKERRVLQVREVLKEFKVILELA